MAVIASLEALVAARTAAFSRGFKRARRTLAGFGRSVAGLVARIGALGGAIIGAAGLTGIALMVRQSFKAIDATAKLADSIGLTTEQLLGYQHAARISGVEQKALETGFRRFEKNISDAQKGLTTAIRAFEDLGLNFDALAQKSPDEALKIIADRMAGMKNQFTKARVAQDLFGRSGIQLIKLLEGGAKGIEEFQKEAAFLGLTFSRIDAAKVEMANDAFTRLKAVFSGIFQQISIRLAPVLTHVVDRLRAAALSGGGMGDIVAHAFEKVLRAVGVVLDAVSLVQAGFYGFQGVALKVAQGIAWAFDKMLDGVKAAINFLLDKLRDLFLKAQSVTQASVQAAEHLGFEKTARSLFKLSRIYGRIGEQLDFDITKSDTWSEAAKQFAEDAAGAFGKMKSAFQDATSRQSTNALVSWWNDINREMQKGAEDAARRISQPIEEASEMAARTMRSPEGREIDLRHQTITGLRMLGKQRVEDQKAHALLAKIEANTRNNNGTLVTE